TTTLEQEFAESRWVVLARVESALDHRPDDGAAWTLYRLRVLRTYKGRLPARFGFFTDRNTGGFYMDRPWEGHDIGGDYLLFLNPRTRGGDPPAARGATFVNYTCSRSRPWAEVPATDRALLDRLSEAR
ncbi:MAG: hypothetical protein QOI38_226, partial [Sphingomonadales bacterium]|nr:hypothetical protein [Sphingomonadales bacterium]